MKIKVKDIVNNVKHIENLSKITSMPIKVSYRIKRLTDKIAPIIDTYNKKRNELIISLGEKNEGDSYTISEVNTKIFEQEHDKLLEIEEDINFTSIKVEELGDITIAPELLVNWIFEY